MDAAENELLTRVGPGTAMGDLLRRYWWPIWFSEQLGDQPVPVRLLGEDLVDTRAPGGVVFGMQPEIEQRELQLAHGRQAGLKSARAQQLRLLVRGQGCTSFEMSRHRAKHLGSPGEILHELARQLDRVPRNSVDAGDRRIGDLRQHVVQPVAEFVEHRHDIIVR